MRKTRLACSGSMPIPRSATTMRHAPPARSAPTATSAGAPGGTYLTALSRRLKSSCSSARPSPCTTGRSPTAIRGGGSASRRGLRGRPRHQLRERDRLGRPRLAPHAGVGEQVVDQRAHPRGALDGVVDDLVGLLVELPAVAAPEQLDEAGDAAQRRQQVVRGGVGERLQLLVGALELARAALERPRRRPLRRDVDHQAHAGRVAAGLGDRQQMDAVDDPPVERAVVERARLAGEHGVEVLLQAGHAAGLRAAAAAGGPGTGPR